MSGYPRFRSRSGGRTPRPSLASFRRALAVFGLPGLLLVVVSASALRLIDGSFESANAGQVAHMRDLAADLSANIAAAADAGMAKTELLAQDARVLKVIAAGDRPAAEQLANELLKDALELDVVAIFGADGELLAVNTADHHGRPIPRERIDSLYRLDYAGRGVVQGCLHDQATHALMEFQTRCDFTPALFDSSGLSVAMSVPVLEGTDGSRAGVVSTRLKFDRITEFVRENSYIRAGNSIYLVSDDGLFFDERVNGGHSPQPLPREQALAAISSHSVPGSDLLIRGEDMALLGCRVPISEAVAGGGIHVLLRASNDWLMAETRREQFMAGGLLLASLVALSISALYANARTDRLRTQVALSAERARMSLILENVGEGVLGIDPDQRVSFVNEAAQIALGASAQDLIGTPFADLAAVHAGGVERAWKQEDAAIRRSDGSVFRAHVSYTLLPDGKGGVATFSDQSDRIRAERHLLDATRLAGKAEVATSVLHNVGNVLNSINVAASVVAEKLRASEIGNLAAAGRLIRDHRDDLTEFLSNDERGVHLPEFLIQVAECLSDEQKALLGELESVIGGVEHVRHVVSMQQAHAKNPHLVEEVVPAEVMEAALEMQQDSLTSQDVVIERRYESLGARPLDKHQVLQILLNLIGNARQAMSTVPRQERVLTLTIREEPTEGADFVVFEVGDNGVGIDPGHMTAIFGHGFTTRRDGHGFGLHSSANAASQMGGMLEAHSDGLGSGARFTLRLPSGVLPRHTTRTEASCTAS